MALFCGCQKWNDAVIAQKPRSTSKIKDNFDAITISGGFEHENRRTKPPHSLDGRYSLAAGAGTLQKRRMQHAKRIHCKSNSCRKSSVKHLKRSSVCSVTALANCFSSRRSSKTSAITSLRRTRILTRQHTRKCAV